MSTSSAEAGPSGRPSISEAPHGPLNLFDTHLRFLADSYLSFFQERKKIEDSYIESLLKLHRRCKTTDIYLNGGHEVPYSTRKAWDEVRDNVEREADTRKAFMESLTVEVINPLIALKETQERIRKRIRDDLKEAISTHSDYAENVFPKLQRAYLKKAQDAEDSKAAASVIPPPLSPTTTYEHNPLVFPKGNTGTQMRPVVTAPQPLRPLDRRPSGSVAPTRARSPSTSTALQDLAHQGKKQLNQLMTFLDKGGNIKETGRSNDALRTVRAKREADEADKEYRKAVHWLETLRLRRVKIVESGYKSLESFVHESAEVVKKVLQRYSDDLLATSSTQTQLCGHARRMVDQINPKQDTAVVSNNIPKMLAAQTPKPLYYQNYTVGECRDLIFGVSLVDYATAKGLGEGEVPKIVRICIKEIDDRGLDAEGIYRVSGRHASVLELQHTIERNEGEFQFNSMDDVYVVSSLFKLYLRELPEPLFKFPLQDRVQHTEELESHIKNNFQLLRSKLRRLPPVHQATLKMVVEHLAKVAAHSDKNKMDAKNLAIIFGSVVFGEDDIPKGGDLLSVQNLKDTLMEDLITHANILFQTNASPPLPPAPLGEPVPTVSYGTIHTKVGEIPSMRRRTPSPATRPQDLFAVPALPRSTQGSESHSALTEDFTPQMPPRPTNSIHPSLRAGPMSGAPARQSLPPPPRPAHWYDEGITYAHVSPQSATATTSPSVPPSPSRRPRVPPSPLPPLKAPWSDNQPVPVSSAPPLNLPSSRTLEELSALEGAHFISLDEPTSPPSSAATFASALTPSSSTSSGLRVPPTPPIPPTSLIPGSPKEPSPGGSYLGGGGHKRSSSLASR